MTVLLIWSLADIGPPLLVTSGNQVFDLLSSDPVAWQPHECISDTRGAGQES